jgi:hypothetical protein
MKKWLPLAAAALVSIFAACSDEGTAENTTPWMSDGKDSIASRDPQTATRDPHVGADQRFKAVTHSTRAANRLGWAILCVDENDDEVVLLRARDSLSVGRGKSEHALSTLNAYLEKLMEREQQPSHSTPEGEPRYPNYDCELTVGFTAPRSSVRHKLSIWLLHRYVK